MECRHTSDLSLWRDEGGYAFPSNIEICMVITVSVSSSRLGCHRQVSEGKVFIELGTKVQQCLIGCLSMCRGDPSCLHTSIQSSITWLLDSFCCSHMQTYWTLVCSIQEVQAVCLFPNMCCGSHSNTVYTLFRVQWKLHPSWQSTAPQCDVPDMDSN